MSARPNFFVVGAARSGTTSFTEMLRAQSRVFVTKPKEPHFLAFAGRRVSFRGPGDDVTVNRVAVTDLDRYLALYRGSGSCTARGEGSVSSLYYSRRSVITLERHFPDARVIAILRDPIERAFSSFQFLRARGFESCTTFEEALDLENTRIRAGWHHLWHYAAMGRYGAQLAPFVTQLGADRVKVVRFEDLEHSPATVLTDVLEFLAVESDCDAVPVRLNASGEPRSRALHRVQARLEASRVARRALSAAIPRRARDWLRTESLRRTSLPESARERLRSYYDDDAALLRSIWHGDTPAWVA